MNEDRKSINEEIMENLFGKVEKKENTIRDKEQKNGFFIDSFHVTGMTKAEYRAWAKRMQVGRENLLFWDSDPT